MRELVLGVIELGLELYTGFTGEPWTDKDVRELAAKSVHDEDGPSYHDAKRKLPDEWHDAFDKYWEAEKEKEREAERKVFANELKQWKKRFALNCHRCKGKATALPVEGTYRHYECKCGNRFTGSRHDGENWDLD